ncbi:capsular associated protein [Hymenopellis radicata]|nr:capsular associated protein [Hymenopellis radicata]
MRPKGKYRTRNRHPISVFLREHVLLLGSLVFSIVTGIFLSYHLGYFSTFLVYLPLVSLCVPFATVHYLITWKNNNECYYRRMACLVWCAYLFLFGLRRSSSATIPELTPRNASYYMAANLYNSAAVLPSWKKEMHELIAHLGEANVFVSIYESNSVDNSAALLGAFKEELDKRGVANKIVTEQGTRGRWGLNSPARIAYMAEIRNKVLQPLKDMERRFSKVIFFNDVFFDWREVMELIDTKRGDYDLACAMDFDGIGLYDIWVVRDACGRTAKEIWPYFSSDSRAVSNLRRHQPIEVASCWNGIAVFNAVWFTPGGVNVTKPSTDSPTRTGDFLPPLPLEFRGSTDCTSSECFIIGMDMHFWNTPQRPKIYVNPRVRVAYEKLNYVFHTQLEYMNLAWPWRLIWQDWIGWRLFGWVSDAIWLKEDKCKRDWEGFVEADWCR